MEHTEQDIFREIQTGSRDAYNELFRLYFNPLMLYARGIVSDSEIAKDIVQEFFIKLWMTREEIGIKVSVKSYLYRSVHNLCIDYLRKEITRAKNKTLSYDDLAFRLEIFEIEDSGSVIESLFTDETGKIIAETIKNLPPQCREIFILSRYRQLSYPEIANRLNISLSTVKTQMIRAMAKLKDAMDRYL